MAYDSPDAVVRRSWFVSTEAGGAATTEYGKFRPCMKSRLRAVHVVVSTAGTATTHAINIYHGTTSIGAIALSTATANATGSNTDIDETLAQYDQVSVKTGADAAGKVWVMYEYDSYHDATLAP